MRTALIACVLLAVGVGCSSRPNGATCTEASDGVISPRTLGDGDPYCQADSDCRTTCTCADGRTNDAQYQCVQVACNGAFMACWNWCNEQGTYIKSIAGSYTPRAGDSAPPSSSSSSASADEGSSASPCRSTASANSPSRESGEGSSSSSSTSSSSSSSDGQSPSSSGEDAKTYCGGDSSSVCVCSHSSGWGDNVASCSAASVGGGLCCADAAWPASDGCGCMKLGCDQISSDTCTCGATGDSVTKAVSSCAKPSNGICCMDDGAFGSRDCTCWQKMSQCPTGMTEVSSCSVSSVTCRADHHVVSTCR